MKAIKSKRKDGKLFYYLILALPLLQFAIFYFGVNINNILLAFQDAEVIGGRIVFSYQGFKQFGLVFANLATNAVQTEIVNSVIYFAVSIVIVMPLTVVFAYYIYKRKLFCGAFKVLLFLPSIISAMIILSLFTSFSDRYLMYVMGTSPISDGDYFTIVLLYVILSFSGSILLYLNAMSQISVSVIEASKIDGASETKTFLHVVVPSIWQTIISFTLIAIAGLGTNQANLYTLYGSVAPGKTQTVGYRLFTLVMLSDGTVNQQMYPYAAACGILLTLVVAPFTFLVKWLMNKFGPSED